MSKESIARGLKRLRDSSGLTSDQVGALIGKSGKTVNAWENMHGQPDADTLLLLCDIYHVPNILDEFRETPAPKHFIVSENEKRLVTMYRNKPEAQPYVNIILGVDEDTATPSPAPVIVRNAALGGGVTRGIATDSPEEAERLQAALEDELSGF